MFLIPPTFVFCAYVTVRVESIKKKCHMKMWLHAGGEVDCSQSLSFSVGFLRPARFD